MKRKNSGMLFVLLLFVFGILFWGNASSAQASPVSANGRLQIKGRQIVNEKGKAFVIKGVSTHGLAWYPQYVNKR